MTVVAIFEEQPGKLENNDEQIVRRVNLTKNGIENIQHLGPMHEIRLFMRPG